LFAGEQSGVVRWSGQPIPGVTVTAVQGNEKVVTTTDDAGHYLFKELGTGAWVLQTEMFGFSAARQEVNITGPASTLDLSLELQPEAGAAVANAAPKAAVPAPGVPAPAAANTASAAATSTPTSSTPAAPAAPASKKAAPSVASAFQSLRMNQNVNGQMTETASPADAASTAGATNGGEEALMVSGSLSSGLTSTDDDSSFVRGEHHHHDSGDSTDSGANPFGSASTSSPSLSGRSLSSYGSRGDYGERRHRTHSATSTSFGNHSGPSINSIRGMAFYQYGDSIGNARPFSLTGNELAEPYYNSNHFGILAGGPVIIPKVFKSGSTFFYVSYFGDRNKSPETAFATVPTLAERSGDFSQAAINGQALTVMNPATHEPFPTANVIPVSMINPQAMGLMSYIPLPNQPGTVRNYRLATTNAGNDDNFSVRLSQTLSKKDTVSFSLNLTDRNGTNTQLFPYADPSTGLSSNVVDQTNGRGTNVTLSWSHNFGAHEYNSLRGTFNRNSNGTLPYYAYGNNVAADLGILGTSQNPLNYGPPNISFTNFGGISDASAVESHYQYWNVTDSVSILRGKHTITFGGGFTHNDNNLISDQNGRGSFSFSGIETSAFAANATTGNLQAVPGSGSDFADFLLGLPQSSSIRFGAANEYFRESSANAYMTEDFRALSNLTFNVGVRYEYFTPYSEKYGHMANLDYVPGATSVTVLTPNMPGVPAGLISSDPLLFSPRGGIAWKPFPKHHMTVRAGYGIFFNGSAYARFPGLLAAQPPYANTASLNINTDPQITLQNGFPTQLVSSQSGLITNTFAVAQNYKVGYAQSWDFSIQQELPHSMLIEVTYRGTKGTGLDIRESPNRAAVGSSALGRQTLLIPDATTFTYDAPYGNSIYHAGQVRLSRRFHGGVSGTVLYTYSKSIDDSSTFGGAGNTVAQNANDLSAERGLSSFDMRQALTGSLIVTSPFGEKAQYLRAGGWKGRLLEDWTLYTSVTAQTGHPFTAQVLGNQSDVAGTGTIGAGRAEATGLPVETGVGFFNPLAFAYAPAGEYGDAGRNTIPGPSLVSMNASFTRSFNVGGDRRRLELRLSANNVLNHPNYTGFGTVYGTPTYGLATAVGGMRTLSALVRFRF
jgi:hypothetical protein